MIFYKKSPCVQDAEANSERNLYSPPKVFAFTVMEPGKHFSDIQVVTAARING